MHIRAIQPEDWTQVWPMLQATFVAGDTYVFAPDTTEAESFHVWVEAPLAFRAMQFNLVVSTNETAARLWQKLGFEIVGTLSGAFRHAQLGYVDAFVMYKQLVRQ